MALTRGPRKPPWRTGVVYVIGLPSGGTSCMAGVLKRLGMSLGNTPHKEVRKYDAVECLDLIAIAHKYLKFHPGTTEPRGEIEGARTELSLYNTIRLMQPGPQAAKYPTIQTILSHDAIQDLPFHLIAIDRPWDDCYESWCRRRSNQPAADLARFFGLLAGHRTALFQKRMPLARIPYYGLIEDPDFWVDHISRVLQLTPSVKQQEDAIGFVNPKRRHYYPANPHTTGL